jgi:hypothetical protein
MQGPHDPGDGGAATLPLRNDVSLQRSLAQSELL